MFSATEVEGSGLEAPYTFKGGSYPGVGGTCGSTITVGTCTLVVSYTPTQAGTHNDTLQLSYNDGESSQSTTRAVTGAGLSPASLVISDGSTYDFGSVTIGQTSEKTFTITKQWWCSGSNCNGFRANLALFLQGVVTGTGGTCSATINVGTCTLVVGTHQQVQEVNRYNKPRLLRWSFQQKCLRSSRRNGSY